MFVYAFILTICTYYMPIFYCKCLKRYRSGIILAYLIFIIIIHYEKYYLKVISNISSKLTLAYLGAHIFSNVLKTLLEKNIQHHSMDNLLMSPLHDDTKFLKTFWGYLRLLALDNKQ